MAIDLKDYVITNAAYRNRFHGSITPIPVDSPQDIPVEVGELENYSAILFYSESQAVYRIEWWPELKQGNFGTIQEFEDACHKLSVRGIYPTKIKCGMHYDRVVRICIEGENPGFKFEKRQNTEPKDVSIGDVYNGFFKKLEEEGMDFGADQGDGESYTGVSTWAPIGQMTDVEITPKPKRKYTKRKKKVKQEVDHLHTDRKMRF